MEDVDPWFTLPTSRTDEVEVGIEDPIFTDWRIWVVILTVCLSLLMTITMMNIFIAVLCDNYSEATEYRNEIFWSHRVRIVLDETFKKQMELEKLRYLCSCLCRRRKSLRFGAIDADVDGSIGNDVNPDEICWNYVWFCQPSDDAMRAADGVTHEDEEEDPAEEMKLKIEHLDAKFQDVSNDIYDMFEYLRHNCPTRHNAHFNRREKQASRRAQSAPAACFRRAFERTAPAPSSTSRKNYSSLPWNPYSRIGDNSHMMNPNSDKNPSLRRRRSFSCSPKHCTLPSDRLTLYTTVEHEAVQPSIDGVGPRPLMAPESGIAHRVADSLSSPSFASPKSRTQNHPLVPPSGQVSEEIGKSVPQDSEGRTEESNTLRRSVLTAAD